MTAIAPPSPPIRRAPHAPAEEAPPLAPLRVVFAGGGTGGHLYPAIAAARALEALAPGSEVLFLGSDKPLERRILEPTGYRHVALPTAPWRGARRALGFAWAQARGLLGAARCLRGFAPDVVLGLGGFPSVGPALAARLLGVPVALFEPNAVPGRANALLARIAQEAFVHWEETPLACARVRCGTPVGARALLPAGLTRAQARAALGLPATGPLLLVMGGSQGAGALNRWAIAAAPALAADGAAVLHLAGNVEAARAVEEAYGAAGVVARVEPFFADVGLAYLAADVAVVRAGGATLAEVAAAGLPAVAVPMPGSAGDHQRHNARAFAASGAGLCVEEAALGPETLRTALTIARQEERSEAFRARARASARPDAARAVALRLARLAGRVA